MTDKPSKTNRNTLFDDLTEPSSTDSWQIGFSDKELGDQLVDAYTRSAIHTIYQKEIAEIQKHAKKAVKKLPASICRSIFIYMFQAWTRGVRDIDVVKIVKDYHEFLDTWKLSVGKVYDVRMSGMSDPVRRVRIIDLHLVLLPFRQAWSYSVVGKDVNTDAEFDFTFPFLESSSLSLVQVV